MTPGVGGAGGVPGMIGDFSNTSKALEDTSESDLAADIDKELGFGSYRIPDLPFGSCSSSGSSITSRKRLYPSDSPIPVSLEASFSSEQPTPKQPRALFTPEKQLPAFQRAEMLLSTKKVSTPTKESSEVVELRKEVGKQKAIMAEHQATVCTTIAFFLYILISSLPIDHSTSKQCGQSESR